MRGFPLLRSFLILLCLAASGIGLARLTVTPPAPQRIGPAGGETLAASAATSLSYRLVLSAEAAEIRIASGDCPALSTASGTLPAAPFITLAVRWKNPPAAGEQRFAKLVLEPAGKPTLTHVFDAPGDIDDILELP